MIHKAYQFRLYPTQEQRIKIEKTLGAVRYVYNHFLKEWDIAYHEVGRGLNFAYCSSQLPKMKRELETAWLKEVDSMALQTAVRQLSDAFIYFYKFQTRFPKPKTKNDYYQRFVSKQVKNNILVKDHHVKIPKIGWIKIKQTQDVIGHITSVTVTKEATGRYFISIMSRFEETWLLPNDKVVAIVPTADGGFFTSDGEYYKNDFVTEEWLERLKREEEKQARLKELAIKQGRKLSQAKNYQKQVKKVARMYADLENHREDFLHKMTTELVEEYGVLCIPRYYKHYRLNEQFFDKHSDTSWEKFVHKLNYKCEWYGRVFYPTQLERRERELSEEQLAEMLCRRARRYVKSIDKFNERTVGATGDGLRKKPSTKRKFMEMET